MFTYTIEGTAEFHDQSKNQADINIGYFFDASINDVLGTITNATFTDTAINKGTATAASFSLSSENDSAGTVTTGTFSNDSKNKGSVTNAVIADTTVVNTGTITGTLKAVASWPTGGTVPPNPQVISTITLGSTPYYYSGSLTSGSVTLYTSSTLSTKASAASGTDLIEGNNGSWAISSQGVLTYAAVQAFSYTVAYYENDTTNVSTVYSPYNNVATNGGDLYRDLSLTQPLNPSPNNTINLLTYGSYGQGTAYKISSAGATTEQLGDVRFVPNINTDTGATSAYFYNLTSTPDQALFDINSTILYKEQSLNVSWTDEYIGTVDTTNNNFPTVQSVFSSLVKLSADSIGRVAVYNTVLVEGDVASGDGWSTSLGPYFVNPTNNTDMNKSLNYPVMGKYYVYQNPTCTQLASINEMLKFSTNAGSTVWGRHYKTNQSGYLDTTPVAMFDAYKFRSDGSHSSPVTVYIERTDTDDTQNVNPGGAPQIGEKVYLSPYSIIQNNNSNDFDNWTNNDGIITLVGVGSSPSLSGIHAEWGDRCAFVLNGDVHVMHLASGASLSDVGVIVDIFEGNY